MEAQKRTEGLLLSGTRDMIYEKGTGDSFKPARVSTQQQREHWETGRHEIE